MSDPPSSLPLPIIDLSPLSHPSPTPESLTHLAHTLSAAFSTTGFAYLTNAPLTLPHASIFSLAHAFFALPTPDKMAVAKRPFNPANTDTYRGYFPPQPTSDNLKEGFEIGPPAPLPPLPHPRSPIHLSEPNVWPPAYPARTPLEHLHSDLQSLATTLLSLLALSLAKPPNHFAYMHHHSLSTLRLLHYPPPPPPSSSSSPFSCTPHTDSGILTLLLQDATGGLEVLSPDGDWRPAPYLPGSIVVNVGDLLARISGHRWRATLHRVRSSPGRSRYSVPFFFEPGGACVVRDVEGGGEGVVYGEHVLGKMRGWVEFAEGVGAVGGGTGVEMVEEVGVGA